MSTSEAQRVPAIRTPVSAAKPALTVPSRGPFPLPRLAVRRTSAVLYGVSTIDNRGRLVDARLMRELAWPPGLALTIAEERGLLHRVSKLIITRPQRRTPPSRPDPTQPVTTEHRKLNRSVADTVHDATSQVTDRKPFRSLREPLFYYEVMGPRGLL